MKRRYVKPAIVVDSLEASQLLVNSVQVIDDYAQQGSGGLSRMNDYMDWNEDEEEY